MPGPADSLKKGSWPSLVRQCLVFTLSALSLVIAATAYIGTWSARIDPMASLLPLTLPFALAALFLSPGRHFPRRLQWTNRIMAMVAILLCLGRIVPEVTATIPGSTIGVPIRVLTHNLHHGGINPAAQVSRLAESGADILLLQENKGASGKALDALRSLYPYRDSCGGCELAILSRWPMDDVHWKWPGANGKAVGPALFRADIHLPHGGTVTVATLHAPRPFPVARQRQFLDDLAHILSGRDTRRLILAGDFNLTPWTAAMRRLDHGLAPMIRISRALSTYPAKGQAPFPFPLLPIDHLFIGTDLAVQEIATLPDTGSDHLPILVTLHMTDGRPSK